MNYHSKKYEKRKLRKKGTYTKKNIFGNIMRGYQFNEEKNRYERVYCGKNVYHYIKKHMNKRLRLNKSLEPIKEKSYYKRQYNLVNATFYNWF